MHKVLIVDDLEDSCSLIAEILSPYFICEYTSQSEKALAMVSVFKPDLILTDYKMPKMNGMELCRSLKESSLTQHIPIIFMSGAVTDDERIETLEFGGDDFIAKPFHPKELILRVKKRVQGYASPTVINESNNETTLTILKIANLTMNLNSRLVYIDDREATLTPKQFEILKLLIENQNECVSRNTFMEEVWGHFEVTPRNVDSQINYLKKKIEGFNGVITAVPSFGYRLDYKK